MLLLRKKESLNTVKERERKQHFVLFLYWPFETLKKERRILRKVGLKGKEKKEMNDSPINNTPHLEMW